MKDLLIKLNTIIAGVAVVACSQAQQNASSTPASSADVPSDYIGIKVSENENYDYSITMPTDDWKERLTNEQFDILRQEGTEPAFSSKLNDNKKKGTYYSAATGQPVFSSETKFESGTGWPSFYKPIDSEAVVLKEDNAYGMTRIEVEDSGSGSHLGHVFPDGPAPTGLRYCINGDALIFVAQGEEPPAIVKQYLESHPEAKAGL